MVTFLGGATMLVTSIESPLRVAGRNLAEILLGVVRLLGRVVEPQRRCCFSLTARRGRWGGGALLG